MAWEYFTDWLEQGNVIAKSQRDELAAALLERGQALDEGAYLEPDTEAPSAAYLSSRSFGCWVGGAFLGGTFHDFCVEISGRYTASDTDSHVWGVDGPGLIEQALEDLGISSGDWSAIIASPLNHHLYWNVIRRCAQLLRYPVLRITGSAAGTYLSYTRSESKTTDTFASFATELLAQTEGSSGSFRANAQLRRHDTDPGDSGADMERGGALARSQVTVAIPDLPIYSAPFPAWVFRTGALPLTPDLPDEVFLAVDIAVRLGSETATLADAGETDWEKLLISEEFAEVGEVELELRLPSYDSTTALGQLDTAGDYSNAHELRLVDASGGEDYLHLAPTFTHPYEEMP